MVRINFFMITLLLGVCLSGYSQTIAPVKVVRAHTGFIAETIEGHGILKPYPKDDVKISAVSPMRIDTIFVKPGDPVKKGQRVLKFQRDQSSDMAVEKARINLEQANINLKRAQKLFENGVIAKVKIEQAQTQYNLEKADYEIQKRSLQYAIENADIRSPIDGVVSSVKGVIGQVADPSQMLVRIVDIHNIIASIGIEIEDIEKIKTGQKAEITIPNFPETQRFKGRVIRQNKEIDLATQLIHIWIELDNKKGLLQPGMFAIAHIFVNSDPNALIVPKSAVLKDQKGAYVFIIKGNKAHKVPVQTGIQTDKMIQILKGIQNSQQVVYWGNYELKEGMQVQTLRSKN